MASFSNSTERYDKINCSMRSSAVASFKVMDVLARAQKLERQGQNIVHLEVGQPQSGAPKLVLDAAKAALLEQRLGYTEAFGIIPLRQRISQHYKDTYDVNISTERIAITTGSSGAFLLAFLAAFDVGDRVAVASASYPCYRNILNSLGCEVVTIPINEQFKVTAAELNELLYHDQKKVEGTNGKYKLKGIILSSPSNPTGAMLSDEELQDLTRICELNGILFISDEIYHGICFGGKKAQTALAYSSSCIVINSFSKFYSMTGWRLGWMIMPDNMIEATNRLLQNLYINAPTLSQVAAIAAFDCRDELTQHVLKYEANRNILLEGLKAVGFNKLAPSDGAFYIYADTTDICVDSVQLANEMLERIGIAVTPGTDFEDPASSFGSQRIRFSFCGSTEDMIEAIARLKKWWPNHVTSH